MSGERAHDEVVSDLTELQGRLRGFEPARTENDRGADAVTVIHGDVAVRVAGIADRIGRLEQDLARVGERIERAMPSRTRVVEWRHFPEFNFCPQVFQLTLDDQIALLQGAIAERLEREN